MDELIIRSLQGRTTQLEEEHLRAWTHSDPANETRYSEFRQLWSLTELAAPRLEKYELIPDLNLPEQRGAEIQQKSIEYPRDRNEFLMPTRMSEAPVQAERIGSSKWFSRTAMFATAAGLAAIGFGLGVVTDEPANPPSLFQTSEIVTGAGEMTTVMLAEGSTIRVGPESRLRLTGTKDTREAWLDGRAFFGIQADSSRPFTVRTEQGTARVLGTRFEVRTEADFRVLVVEGAVSVSANNNDTMRIADGEMGSIDQGGRLLRERVEDPFAELAWIGNALVFQATPLSQALAEIERRYGIEIDTEDSDLSDLSVTASFTGQPVDEVVFVLCEIVNAHCSLQDNQLQVRRGSGVSAP